MSYVKVLKPTDITPNMLVSCNVTEDDYLVWSSLTSYSKGTRVIKSHKIWESVADGNTGHDPEEVGSIWWVYVSVTNRWKMLDLSSSTKTIKTGVISYTINTGKIVAGIGAVNIRGDSMRVRVVDPIEGVVYDTTKKLTSTIPESNWWSWFFGETIPIEEIVFEDLPAYSTANIMIDIDAGDGVAEIGALCLGVIQDINFLALHGAEIGMLDFGKKSRDDWGEIVLKQGNYAETLEIPCMIKNNKIPQTRRLLHSFRQTPCMWIITGLPIVFGWYSSFSIQVAYYSDSTATITIEGFV